MALAWYVGGVTPTQKSVLVALADHADEKGEHVYPGVKRLCKKTSCAERTVRRALADLRDMGLITAVREAAYHHTTEYRLDLPEMQARQDRPAADAPHDLPESPQGVPESPLRGARAAPKPSYNHQEPAEREERARATPNRFWQLPESLNNAPFVKVWARWLQYIDERTIDFTETQAELTLEDLSRVETAVATDSVRTSIRKGWRNIYLPENGSGSPDVSAVTEWESVLSLSSQGKLASLPMGPTRDAVLSVGADRINSMTANQRPFVYKDFRVAYEQATAKSQQQRASAGT